MEQYRKGQLVKAIVSGIETYGAFVKIDEYYSGLIHISELSNGYVRSVETYAKIGDQITVKILDIDEEKKKMKLSIKNIQYKGGSKKRRLKIIETSSGFKTLAYKLPFWIAENLQNEKNKINSIDK